MPNHQLSKSTILRGIQCSKSLYLYKHNYELRSTDSSNQQSIFESGTEVGLLARNLFPDGVDASSNQGFKMKESVEKTRDYIDAGETVIYEATFVYDDVLVAVDILVKTGDSWNAFEVKSSTSISDTNILDAAVQYHTIDNSGINLNDISIIYINNSYIKNGQLEVDRLFSIESVLENVIIKQADIQLEIQRLKEVINAPTVPEIGIGEHCLVPYACDFKEHCWKHIPKYSVFDISRLKKAKKFELYDNGILTLDDVFNSETKLSQNQALQVTAEIEGRTHINKQKIGEFIAELRYPLYYLDFEAINPAIPLYDNTKPYQQVVFQYSLHIQDSADSALIHKEYLAEPSENPQSRFVEQLIDECGTDGDILVYNIGFERSRLKELMEIYPDSADKLESIINRLTDLMIPFSKKWYYTPEMRGSYSIKAVLPALVPELSYNDLVIQEGGTASNTFLSMIYNKYEGDVEKTRLHLLKYCELDTLAMVKILDFLQTTI